MLRWSSCSTFHFKRFLSYYLKNKLFNLKSNNGNIPPSLLLLGLPGLQIILKISSYLRLNCIQPSHLHLQKAVFPVIPGHPGIVNAARDVTERAPILDKAVAAIINPKSPLRYILHTHKRKVLKVIQCKLYLLWETWRTVHHYTKRYHVYSPLSAIECIVLSLHSNTFCSASDD